MRTRNELFLFCLLEVIVVFLLGMFQHFVFLFLQLDPKPNAVAANWHLHVHVYYFIVCSLSVCVEKLSGGAFLIWSILFSRNLYIFNLQKNMHIDKCSYDVHKFKYSSQNFFSFRSKTVIKHGKMRNFSGCSIWMCVRHNCTLLYY